MAEGYGERLAHAREDAGLGQQEFADLVGIPLRTLQDIESGKVAKPQRRTREKIDAALGARTEGETEAEWPTDLQAFLNILGAFLSALPTAERVSLQNDTIVRLAKRTPRQPQ